MSEILIVVNPKNVDANKLSEIAGAVGYLGGSEINISEEAGTVTATLPSNDVDMVHLIEGVTYVRPTMSWFKKAV